jgi:hypothetical protein
MNLKLKRDLAALLFIGSSLFAQSPISDKLVVTFSKPVMIGDQRIEPGEYTIRQLTSAANPRILEFTTDNGTKLQATASAIPVLDNLNTKRTTVEVYEGPGDYQLHRIWIEGKSYGYEFPASSARSERELAQSRRMVIRGTYTPDRQEVAQATPPPAQPTEAATTPAEPQQQPPPPQREPEPAPPAPQREPEPAPVPQSDPPPPAPPEQAQAQQTTTPPMPATATNWYTIALTGLLLVGLGLTLERVRS